MPHMVIYRSTEGKPAYHQADGVDDAVRFVEHMRNHEHVGEARIFAMHEVPIEFRTYYRVEVAAAENGPPAHESEPVKDSPVSAGSPQPAAVQSASARPAAIAVESPLTPPDEPSKPEPAAASSMNGSGRFGLFGKG